MSEAPLARRKLGNELLRLRERKELTQAEIGEILWTSATTVHRMEQGRSQIKGPQIEKLLRELGIDDAEFERYLLDLASRSQSTDQPYDKYRESFSQEGVQFFGYEEVAKHIRDLQIVFIPGLLQTEGYAREIIQSVQGVKQNIEGFLSSRKDRQRKIVDRPDPPMLSFIIDEAVLYRPFGSADLMAEQLHRLRELERRPRISINVVPMSIGASPALRGSFTLLEFDHYPDVLFIESSRGDVNIDEPEATAARRATWTAIEEHHVAHGKFDDFVQRALDNLGR